MSTTTGGGLRAPLRPLVHVGGGVDRRAGYHEERGPPRFARRSTGAWSRLIVIGCCRLWWSPCRRRASSCTWMPRTTVSASFDDRVQEGKVMYEWQSGAHQPLEEQPEYKLAARWMRWSLRASRGVVGSRRRCGHRATALPGRRPSALSASLWQLAAAEGAAAAARTRPVR